MPGSRQALAVLVAVAAHSGALALTDEEVFRELRINRINPGARSLALGGAFVSLADDATAAQANPSGLSFLRVPEYFVELRGVDSEASSSVRTATLPGDIATFVATGNSPDDVVSPTFLSAVTVHDKWALGFSAQDLVNMKAETASTFSFTTAVPDTFFSLQTGSIEIDVLNVNVSLGGRLNDHLALGGTLTYSQLNVDANVVNSVVDTSGSILGEPVYEPTLDLATAIDDSDRDVVFSLGLLYKWAKWQLGAVYRHGPDFLVTERVTSDGLDFKGVTERVGREFGNRFHLPDVIAVGASWRPSDLSTLAADLEWVQHSNLADDFVPGINVLTDEDWRFDSDDAADVHLGFERILLNLENALPPMALRCGAFSESDNTIRAKSTGAATIAPPEIFGGAGRQAHFSLGMFFALGRHKLDVAADFADTDNEYVVSLIFQGK